MMGRLTGDQAQFFYEFRLEDRVPANHLLRQIDAVLDLSQLHQLLAPFYSHTGRPSIDPELMLRMLIVGYCFGIRSERRLCEEVSLNLAYRWFCRLGLEDEVPDHSTFGKNRHGRFRESDLFRHVFETVVRRCMDSGLVRGEGFAVDATVIEANASRFKRALGADVEWAEPARQTRAVREYLVALDSENSPQNPEREPSALSPSDPASAWTTKGRLRVQFAYGLNYLIDDEHAVIVDVEATPARISKEVASTKTMIKRTAERMGLVPKHVAGDSAYGTGGLLGWLVDQGIDPHIPVWDKSERTDGTLGRADFTYDVEDDCYICPQGKVLTSTGRVHDGRTLYYRSSKLDCDPCALKQRCCPKGPYRRIPRDVNEHGRDHARSLASTQQFEDSSRRRKKIEMLFAHLKHQLGFERLRLRGPSGARDEFLLAATVQNLRRLARLTNQVGCVA
jgi:transposase